MNKGGRGCWNARVPGGERKERRGEKVEEEGGDGRRNDTARSWKVEKREREREKEKGRAEEKTGEEGRWYNLVGSNAGYSAPTMQ